uniref:Uncharacterized protein n=1 Tax=Romanomermis culicivorax TaxID=13658 RepID=A0A915I009_ROMCU
MYLYFSGGTAGHRAENYCILGEKSICQSGSPRRITFLPCQLPEKPRAPRQASPGADFAIPSLDQSILWNAKACVLTILCQSILWLMAL